MEGTLAASVADHAVALVGYAQRFRIMGSLALSMCQFAAGRVDAVVNNHLAATGEAGISIAVARHGALVFRRGYGLARRDIGERMLAAEAASLGLSSGRTGAAASRTGTTRRSGPAPPSASRNF